jgi:hypothetical protein
MLIIYNIIPKYKSVLSKLCFSLLTEPKQWRPPELMVRRYDLSELQRPEQSRLWEGKQSAIEAVGRSA